jgi:transposase
MAKPILSDELWEIIEPLLLPEPAKPKGGRPRVPNRAALTGIIFVLKTGLPWEYLPPEMGCGSGITCCEDCETGNKPVCERSSTKCCWIS